MLPHHLLLRRLSLKQPSCREAEYLSICKRGLLKVLLILVVSITLRLDSANSSLLLLAVFVQTIVNSKYQQKASLFAHNFIGAKAITQEYQG